MHAALTFSLRLLQLDLIKLITKTTYHEYVNENTVGLRFNGLIGGRDVRYCRKSIKSNVF
jgi:hypothetical protein